MITKVYKVVIRESISLCDKKPMRLVSTWAPKRLMKEYRVGRWTFPMPKTKLFAFANIKEAREYLEIKNNAFLYCAEAENVESNGWIDYQIDMLEVVQDLFARHRMHKPAPRWSSAVVCDAIRLIKRIK